MVLMGLMNLLEIEVLKNHFEAVIAIAWDNKKVIYPIVMGYKQSNLGIPSTGLPVSMCSQPLLFLSTLDQNTDTLCS